MKQICPLALTCPLALLLPIATSCMEPREELPGAKRRRTAWQAPEPSISPTSSSEQSVAPLMYITGTMRIRDTHDVKSYGIMAHLLETSHESSDSAQLDLDAYAAKFCYGAHTVTFWHQGNNPESGSLTALVEEQSADETQYVWGQLPGVENNAQRLMKLGGANFRLIVTVLRTLASASLYSISSNSPQPQTASPSVNAASRGSMAAPLPSEESEVLPLAQRSQPEPNNTRPSDTYYDETAYDLIRRVSQSSCYSTP